MTFGLDDDSWFGHHLIHVDLVMGSAVLVQS